MRLPKDTSIILGNSEKFTLRRIYALEHRLSRDPTLRKEYNKFMENYQALGHMSEISRETLEKNEEHFFLSQ